MSARGRLLADLLQSMTLSPRGCADAVWAVQRVLAVVEACSWPRGRDPGPETGGLQPGAAQSDRFRRSQAQLQQWSERPNVAEESLPFWWRLRNGQGSAAVFSARPCDRHCLVGDTSALASR